ncbi:MAG: hypothetical protein NTY77_02910 [Elusimicrobia bacterium]|nr:hypothetical protein [Elusimicrobiota bacterium]
MRPQDFRAGSSARIAFLLIGLLGLFSWRPARAYGLPVQPPWKATYDRIASARDELSVQVRDIWTVLQKRIKAERPDLLARLEPAPPKPRPTGYALLPEVRPDGPEKIELHEVHSSLADLAVAVVSQKSVAADLSVKLSSRTADLGALLDGYERLSGIFKQIDGNLNYHANWQPRAESFKPFNELLEAYRVLATVPMTPETMPRIEAARVKLDSGLLLGFAPTPGLHIQEIGPGVRVMFVRIQTDIEDEAFLRAFSEAVALHWNGGEAMKKAGLQIILDWSRRSPSSLYPKGPPARGTRINTDAHLARFDPALLVLTTGAESSFETHRAIFLAPGTTTRRILAHEFAHLLGFTDFYLHAFEGSPEDPNGVTWWEVCTAPRDLMCNATGGRVSDTMVNRLLSAYGGSLPTTGAR